MYKILANLPFKSNHVHYLPSCHSTNEVAQDLIQSDVAEGTIVITDDQFAGKGQTGNIWLSDSGQNLAFSLILRPNFLKPNEQFLITVAISLAIKDALEEILPGEVQVKWPNDIYFNNKKISGLLIENILRGNYFDSCIVGIGLNVNQIDFPNDFRATSIKLVTNQNVNLNLMLNSLMKSISSFYFPMKEGKGKLLQQQYNESLLGLGEERKFIAGGEEFIGRIEGTDEFGRLQIRRGKDIFVFQHKEVEWLF